MSPRSYLRLSPRSGILMSVSAPAGARGGLLRAGIVFLLLVAAVFAALPWLGCGWGPPTAIFNPLRMRICTFGDPALQVGYGIPGFAGPYYGNLLAGIAYLVASAYVAVTKRSF